MIDHVTMVFVAMVSSPSIPDRALMYLLRTVMKSAYARFNDISKGEVITLTVLSSDQTPDSWLHRC